MEAALALLLLFVVMVALAPILLVYASGRIAERNERKREER